MGAVRDYYAGKVVLLTGATGLLGKVLVEKLLRDFTHIRRLYVLIRPKTHPNGTVTEPRDRLWQEVFQSSAFDRLRGALGDGFSTLVEEKVTAVAGDLSKDRLGMDDETYRRLQGEVELIINCAAMVTFDGPLDTGVSLNTLGPRRVLEFASAGSPAIAHVSTCYVNGTRQGAIAEEPLDPRLVVNGAQGAPYDVDEEVQALLRRVAQIKARPLPLWKRISALRPRAPEASSTRRAWVEKQLVDEGLRWARSRGWSDTYTFTKALGEQLLLRYRGDVPVVIVRPAIIEGALEAPEPGWLDGFRMLDPLVVAYGRGSLPDFPGNPQSVLDIVPADVVVNALLAIVPRARSGDDEMVYQVASGVENPITLREFADLVQDHFQHRSLTGRSGAQRPLPRVTFPKRDRFLRRLRYRFILPLRVLEALSIVLSPLPQGRRLRQSVRSRLAALGRLEYYIRIYGPYSEVSCQYISQRVRAVWEELSEDDRAMLNFDLSGLDWRHYIQDVYVPGIRRFLLGMTAPQERAAAAERVRSLHGAGEDADGAAPAEGAQRAAPAGAGGGVLVEERRSAPGIVAAPRAEVDRWARRTLVTRAVRWSFRFVTGLGYRFWLSLRCEGIENIPTPGPFIVAANHNSHLDTGAIIQSLGKRADRVSALAAKDYWFKNKPMSWFADTVLGTAPFDRHGRVADSLGLAVGLLGRGRSLLFFPQGGRSSSGEPQPFKGGIGLLALETGVPVVPARVTGTYRALPKGRFLPRRHPVKVRFGPPIYPDGYRQSGAGTDLPEAARRFAADVQRAVEALG